jgi:hypothetical protein
MHSLSPSVMRPFAVPEFDNNPTGSSILMLSLHQN